MRREGKRSGGGGERGGEKRGDEGSRERRGREKGEEEVRGRIERGGEIKGVERGGRMRIQLSSGTGRRCHSCVYQFVTARASLQVRPSFWMQLQSSAGSWERTRRVGL